MSSSFAIPVERRSFGQKKNGLNWGAELIRRGKKIVLPWGSPEERDRVLRIQARLGTGAEVPDRMSIGQLMEKISSSDAVIGLDTGMTHLSAAMGRPTVGIFRDYPIELGPVGRRGQKESSRRSRMLSSSTGSA